MTTPLKEILLRWLVTLTSPQPLMSLSIGHMTWKQPIMVPLNAAVIDNREQYLKEILLRWLVTLTSPQPLMSLSVQTDETSKDRIPFATCRSPHINNYVCFIPGFYYLTLRIATPQTEVYSKQLRVMFLFVKKWTLVM